MDSHVIWSPGMSLEDIERQVIIAASSFYRSKAATAAALGVSVKTIDNKFEKYKADDDAKAAAVEERRRASAEFIARQRGDAPAEPVPTPTSPDALNAGNVAAVVQAAPVAHATPKPAAPMPPPRRVEKDGLDDILGPRTVPAPLPSRAAPTAAPARGHQTQNGGRGR